MDYVLTERDRLIYEYPITFSVAPAERFGEHTSLECGLMFLNPLAKNVEGTMNRSFGMFYNRRRIGAKLARPPSNLEFIIPELQPLVELLREDENYTVYSRFLTESLSSDIVGIRGGKVSVYIELARSRGIVNIFPDNSPGANPNIDRRIVLRKDFTKEVSLDLQLVHLMDNLLTYYILIF